MDRTDIRNRFIERRGDMPRRVVARKSRQITKRLIETIDWDTVSAVHIYQSVPRWNEVDTARLSTYVKVNWPNVSVVVGTAHKSSDLPTSSFDLIVVPLVVFDSNLHRLGFGGGWYDRFLAKQPNALKIGLGYDSQYIDAIDARDHDIPLDMIVTESRIFKK
jgi:5-formyltetrahydrofolate cyclo-ligase